MKKIVAVIVTYNRKDLLMECLEAILSQTYSVESIFLVDNASTDGTFEALKDKGYINNNKVQYIRMKTNTGGAGGFYEGLKQIKKCEYDWVWIMDDDTIPSETCLEKLIEAIELVQMKRNNKKISYVASAIYGANDEFMNLPSISNKLSNNGYAYWYEFLADGLVNISSATFVSILVNKKAVDKCGLPCKDYFIWGDDTEYTTRLTKYYGDAYFVGKSIAIHKRVIAKALSIDNEEDVNRMQMYHYFFRNQLINWRYYGTCRPYRVLISSLLSLFKSIGNKTEFARKQIILKGTWKGIVQYKKFKSYIDSQIQNNGEQ